MSFELQWHVPFCSRFCPSGVFDPLACESVTIPATFVSSRVPYLANAAAAVLGHVCLKRLAQRQQATHTVLVQAKEEGKHAVESVITLLGYLLSVETLDHCCQPVRYN